MIADSESARQRLSWCENGRNKIQENFLHMNDNKIQLFKNEEFGQIRAIIVDEEPWFIASDVCKALDIKNASDATSHLYEDEKGIVLNDTLGGSQKMIVVNESGLYGLVMRSRKKEAKLFQRWVTHDVLPSIRKHGGYLTPQKIEEVLLNPDAIIELATQLKLEREKTLALSQQIEADKPKVEWADRCLESNTTLKIGEYAKLIHKENDIEIGQNRLFKFLRNRNILNENNMPYQEYMDRGWFEVIERPVQTVDGMTIRYTPKVTPKGQQGLLKVITKYYNK